VDILNLDEELLSLGWVVDRIHPPALIATFIVKATLRLRPDELPLPWPEGPDPLSGDVHREDDPTRSLRYSSDLVPFKPRADVLLVGTAHPAGRTVSRLELGLRVGTASKRLVVLGERSWDGRLRRGEVPSEPDLLSGVPVAYELALGGPGSAKNPVGRGQQSDLAPRLEYPARPVRSRDDDLDPAGFGPIARDWEPRRSLVGTYSDTWVKERWPSYPEDFDSAFFNAAPADQQREGYLRGDEELELENLHPDHRIYRSRLPALRARCFLDQRTDAGELVFREVPLCLDTLWMDMDAEKLVLVWRGRTAVRSRALKDVEGVVVLAEQLGEPPRSAEYYDQLRKDRLAEEDEAFEAAFFDVDTAADDEAFEREMAEVEKECADLEKALDEFEVEPARLASGWRQAAAEEGLDPQDVVEGSSATLDDVKAACAAAAANLRSELPSDAPVAFQPGAELGEIEAALTEMQELDALAEEPDPEDRPPWTRESVEAAAARHESLAEANLSELDLSNLHLSDRDLRGADLSKANLSGATLARADLTNADLTGTDLTGADLAGANLDGADLSGARVEQASLRGASLSDANLSGLHMPGADFTGCSGSGADFSGCGLAGARFMDARLPFADFSGANLAHADFRRAAVESADFEAVRAPAINMEHADLTGLRASSKSDFSQGNFRKTSARGSLWEEAVLDGADFSGATLSRAQFAEASLRETLFDRAELPSAVFDDTCLRNAILTRANLLRVSFERADLTAADLRESNLYESSFWEAVLEGTNIRGANVKRTRLA
jgi:uncharacterized protein YjbI with pentapeptide repeats